MFFLDFSFLIGVWGMYTYISSQFKCHPPTFSSLSLLVWLYSLSVSSFRCASPDLNNWWTRWSSMIACLYPDWSLNSTCPLYVYVYVVTANWSSTVQASLKRSARWQWGMNDRNVQHINLNWHGWDRSEILQEMQLMRSIKSIKREREPNGVDPVWVCCEGVVIMVCKCDWRWSHDEAMEHPCFNL
jgi:hypothetical protein